jgi:ATP-dependent Lon protease
MENKKHFNCFTVKKSSLKSFLGPAKFYDDRLSYHNISGMATGLAWTSLGGELLSIESTKIKGKGQVILTGQLGNVMKESVQTAISWVKSQATNLKVSQNFYHNTDIHIHFPSAGIPKDGPSAGVTIATALVSLLTEKYLQKDIAMTGEITLSGFVLPVGGIKEKVLAAHRSNISTVLLPAKNKQDLYNIPSYVKNKINFILVNTIEEAIKASITI